MSDPNLAYQFNGPYVQALMAAIQSEIDETAYIIEYLNELSIESADATELATIGDLIGYPWPAAPANTFNDNNFLFGTESSFPTLSDLNGFGGVSTTIGGLLSSAFPEVGNIIPIGFYRLLLTQVAYLKYTGLSLTAIDQICYVFGPDYEILQLAQGRNYFTFGEFADFPNSSALQGFSGVNPPYTTQGGLLYTSDPSAVPDSDIYIVFHTQIGAGYLWLIQNIFNRFTTAPQVFVSQGA